MEINEDLKTKSMKVMNDLSKYTNDIKEIFSDYHFEIKSDELKPFISITLLYDAIKYSPTESITKDIDLLNFLLNNEEGCKLLSLKQKNYFTMNTFQVIEYANFLKNKISKEIRNLLDYTSSRTNLDLSAFETSQLSIDEWYQLFKKADNNINDNELQTIEYILKFSTTKDFITNKINKKGTEAISNHNLAFIYDLLYYIQNKHRDNNSSPKEKSDYIRYRLRKISWEKIMGKN